MTEMSPPLADSVRRLVHHAVQRPVLQSPGSAGWLARPGIPRGAVSSRGIQRQLTSAL